MKPNRLSCSSSWLWFCGVVAVVDESFPYLNSVLRVYASCHLESSNFLIIVAMLTALKISRNYPNSFTKTCPSFKPLMLSKQNLWDKESLPGELPTTVPQGFFLLLKPPTPPPRVQNRQTKNIAFLRIMYVVGKNVINEERCSRSPSKNCVDFSYDG